jgi:maltose alpha-D-glucosyltransferase / alpha-amylase
MLDAQHRPQDNLRWFEASSLSSLLLQPLSEPLSATLRNFIREQRWFRGKARTWSGLQVLDILPLSAAVPERAAPGLGTQELVLVSVRVAYEGGDEPEVYVFALARGAASTQHDARRKLLGLTAQGRVGSDWIVYDPSGTAELSNSLIQLYRETGLSSAHGRVVVQADEALSTRLAPDAPSLDAHGPSGDQSNTTLFFSHELMLKVFRQLEEGMNPDVEICRFLRDHGYQHAPEPLGYLQYTSQHLSATLSAVQRYIPSQGTAWEAVGGALQRALSLALQRGARTSTPEVPRGDLLQSAREPLPTSISELIGSLAPLVRQLAQRTAELHLCLASDSNDPAFSPEPFNARYQHTLVDHARARLTQVYTLLRKHLAILPAEHHPIAEQVLSLHDQLELQLEGLPDARIQADRIRCHGDYHLGQVLYTAAANDFVIIDFEGEPAQPLAVRRGKHSALYDVCGMLRSFHYAATVAVAEVHAAEKHKPEDKPVLSRWADAFYRWCSALFLGSYLARARKEPGKAVFLPEDESQLRALLRLHMLDKCAYELGYELNNRPDWVLVPLAGLLNLAEQANREATGSAR